jgi:SpoVK/Ycf46/Vps4 family AAA+-type ATPase
LIPTRKTITALLGRDPSAGIDEVQTSSPDPGVMRVPDRCISELLLEPATQLQIDEILSAARCREHVLQDWGFARQYQRGLSLSALFDGEPGTGKTLAAEILASELDLPLQRVNMAAVLDKYVGGTEKNLQRVFHEARTSQRVLLFDEADALFSSRVQVESSQDRYANLEINLLLQLMEDYDGIVVLTTNLAQGIDKAFERRIGYKVHFPFPSSGLREQLWRGLIPAELPLAADIGFADLAERFELSGGSIRNAILRAAYVAAGAEREVDGFHLERAAEQVCAASGKLYQPRSSGRDRFEI